ncbi:hypothetical protein COT51_02315 [candidate division WWE3 bacterium CG08_land_8_20_14_0_20_41_15]|uniref:Uncharacterized protein n=1 Tax=candidate division WWE3 bacterium CG08_land_8_20_14_0_20_41_15 TaxID=1975086 RepID=A0A2H0X9K8_UNCKA|nr:MAG: hypothetical protein COT51_02315 [candidate division WWE3 bacterium CG08_land_8_20_14_0_20_41_15]
MSEQLELQGPFIMGYTVMNTPLRISLGTTNKIDPQTKLRHAKSDVSCLEGVTSPQDFMERAMKIFQEYGFVRVD